MRYKKLLNSSRWRRTRAAVMESQPLCADCAREGVMTPAEEVHHIRPVDSIKDPDMQFRMTFDRSNLVALCRDCHLARHKGLGKNTKEENRRRANEEAARFAERFYGTGGDPGGRFSKGGGGL